MVVLFLSADTTSAETLPTEEVINNLAESAKLTTDTFMQQSFRLRMQYEYSGRFLTGDDKENLHKLAQSAGDKLQPIAKKQETLKQQIEDYQDDDWDKRYGSTGLWRKLSADIYTTKLSKFRIDYYLALASKHPQRDQILHLILSEIDALAQSNRQFGPNLIRGKTLALLAQTEPSYKDAAAREFEAFAVYSDIYRPTAAAIEKMKLLSHADTNQLNILIERLRSNWNERYLELILSLIFPIRCKYVSYLQYCRVQPTLSDAHSVVLLKSARLKRPSSTPLNCSSIRRRRTKAYRWSSCLAPAQHIGE